MNELHLFCGIGGGLLASQLLGHRTVCAIELDPFCRSVLVQRQNDGSLPPFPIWDDIRTFDGRDWRGIVDVVSGGFPCQNISPAGNRTGIFGTQSSLWFEMLRVVREVRPEYVFVENSALLVRRGLDVILGNLAESGYDAEWCVLGADDVGAPHIRKRCWILGRHTNYKRTSPIGKVQTKDTDTRRVGKIAHTNGQRQPQSKRFVKEQRRRTGDAGNEVPNTGHDGLIEWERKLQSDQQVACRGTDNGGGTPFDAFREWWTVEPNVGRVANGISHRTHRLKGLGNAQVPLCAAIAWTILYRNINEEIR